MSTVFIGWDVGAWHCDTNRISRDAVCVLAGNRLQDLEVMAEPYRGNLRENLTDGSGDDSLSKLLCQDGQLEEAVVAIDAPLGWPKAFRRLLAREGTPEPVPQRERSNPYLFRETDRRLFEKGFRPLSPVTHMIGSQSSKAIYFLAKGRFHPEAAGVWSAGSWKAIETYPAVARTSVTLRPHFDRIRRSAGIVSKDIEDALWCALIGALFQTDRERLCQPGERTDTVAEEGWIWVPDDCRGPKASPGAA